MHKESSESVIKRALGDSWDSLDTALRRHYDVTPGSNTETISTGTMHEIDHSPIAGLLLIPGRILGALITDRGRNIPTTVRKWTTDADDQNMFWHRTFLFPEKKPVIFTSRMEYIEENEIIEYVRFGLGMRMRLSVDNGGLIYESTCYQWDIGKLSIRIPTWLLMGGASVREYGVSDTVFEMDFQMHHPLFGRTFNYSGRFEAETKTKEGS